MFRASAVRGFHRSPTLRINPIMPFDMLDNLENDDLKDDKKVLEKQKQKLKQKIHSDKIVTEAVSEKGKYTTEPKPEPKPEPEPELEDEPEPSRFSKFKDKAISFFFKVLETGGITFVSVAILAAAGLTYHRVYEQHVLDKMDQLFDEGDMSFDLAIHERNHHEEDWVMRPQQQLMDDIVSGKISGRYFLLIGEKGTGKTSMVLESFSKVNGYNCTAFEAHADPEIFRIRLGKAFNFQFFEDYIGSLFSIRGPRDTTAILDIERAFIKLEEVAIKRVQKTKKPVVIFINAAHLIRNNEEGVHLIELLQQKAEELSGAGLATIIFNSDDYWLYERFKQLGTKLEVISITDLSRNQAVKALKLSRKKFFQEDLDDPVAHRVYDLVGGRPQHLAHVSKHRNMIVACHEIIDREKTWFLNQCGLLGEGMDDDVMESGKFSTSAMLLAKEFVEMDKERLQNSHGIDYDHHLPLLPLWRARQVMTRPDYIQEYDNLNIFTIDHKSHVKADSVPMMRGFHEICAQPGFEKLLDETCERVSAIESLGRTRELVAKDLVLGGHYKFKTRAERPDSGSSKYRELLQNQYQKEFAAKTDQTTRLTLHGGTREDDDKDGDDDGVYNSTIPLQDFHHGADTQWWDKRMKSDYVTNFSNDDSVRQEISQRDDLSRRPEKPSEK